jgi:hypothetical protein
VVFTDVSQPKWFQIHWVDGTSSYHDARLLSRLERLEEDEEPDEIMPRPQPVTILAVKSLNWSIATLADIQQRLHVLILGQHNPYSLQLIFDAVKSQKIFTKLMQVTNKTIAPSQLEMLNAVLDLSSCKVILDPFSCCNAVRKGLQVPPKSKLVLNDRAGDSSSHLQMEPLEPAMYRRVIATFGRLDAVVMCPPAPLAEFALCTAIEFASSVVCMCVPETWVVGGWQRPRGELLDRLVDAGQLVFVQEECVDDEYEPPVDTKWLLVFPTNDMRASMINSEVVVGEESYITICMDRSEDGKFMQRAHKQR